MKVRKCKHGTYECASCGKQFCPQCYPNAECKDRAEVSKKVIKEQYPKEVKS